VRAVSGMSAVRGVFIALLAAAVVVSALPAAAAGTSANELQARGSGRVPVAGATFNDPSTYGAPQNRIINYLNDMIDQTPSGQTIRITQYNLTCGSTVDKIIRAFRRGVNVQIVVNDRVLSEDVSNRGLYKRLRKLLGGKTSKPSFFVICDRGCRGKGGALHTKFVTITKVRTDKGPRTNLIFTASGNITCGWATARQYNDQYAIVGRADLFNSFNSLFAQLAADKRVRSPFRVYRSGPYTAWFFPRPGANRFNDPVYRALKAVKCRGAQNTPGGRTIVKVKMFTWNGNRGMTLARELYKLDQKGCRVEVILGAPGAGVVRELRRPGRNGGIGVWDSRRDRNFDGELDLYTHMKMLSIKGWLGKNRSAMKVYTGSANWTQDAYTIGDEMVIRVSTARAWNQYDRHFEYVKTRSNRRSNIVTTVAKIRPYNLNPIAE
jgi:phosphatidylserine/phosphatidylglycerophosphate/cardiolipin synthase-like enzyme